MTHTKLQLLAVDLDGTLVDSAPDIAHCLGSALVAVGFAAPGEALTRSWIGDGLETLIARALAHARAGLQADDTLQEAALAAFLRCYRDNLFVRSRLYSNAIETLDAFRSSGIRVCCITNKRYAFSKVLLEQARVLDRFELLIGGDTLAEKKPSPLPLTFAARSLGVPPSAALLAGDSMADLGAARAAGYGFAYASYGYGSVDDARLGSALRLAEFADLRTLLAR